MNAYSFIHRKRHQTGLTLVEILVSSVISLALLAGVVQLFMGTRQTYRFHEAASRIQEDGRFALEAMTNDIRMAGYIPTPNSTSTTSSITTFLNNSVTTTGSDLTVQWVDTTNALCAQTCNSQANCCSRTYSLGTSVGGNVATNPCLTAGNSLGVNYNDNNGNQELVEGVDQMQLWYGVCTDADSNGYNDGPPTAYVNAAAVTAAGAWARVCSVRVHLLLVSLEDNVIENPQTYVFPVDSLPVVGGAAPTQFTPTDRCFRQAFSTTIAIRNRMPP